MKVLDSENNFLAISEPELCSLEQSRFVIQQVPYEYTSSYHSGSALGPQAIVDASHYVEFYDEVLDKETYKSCGICTLAPIEFGDRVDAAAIDLIEEHTVQLLNLNKTVVSFGAEHTVTLGFVKAYQKKFPDLCVLQIDAHSDLRLEYHGNPYSHASVMARVHDLNIPITQVGIRAQCKQESDLIQSSDRIHTFYAHEVVGKENWIEKVVNTLGDNVYITIDADGFDPSVVPNVGTAEPGGLSWYEVVDLMEAVCQKRNVIGFDIVEVAPIKENTLSEFTLAKLAYRIMGFITGR
ncbi:MAG TPA: agmatinase [Bacteroidia bacterium]|nr:agmatinase [Bacteroidia bacterium]